MSKAPFIALAAALIGGFSFVGSAHAQAANAIVVPSCGTPPFSYSAGIFAPQTMDTTGTLCTAGGGGGGGGAVTAIAGAFADGWNVTLGTKSDAQSPWNLSAAASEMQIMAQIAIEGSSSTYSNAPVSFYQVSTTSAVALPAHALYNGIVCTAAAANTGTVYLGPSTVTAGTGTPATAGYPLKAGNSISYGVSNSNLVYIIGSDTSEGLNCTGS